MADYFFNNIYRLEFKVQMLVLFFFNDVDYYRCITDARRKLGIAQVSRAAAEFSVI